MLIQPNGRAFGPFEKRVVPLNREQMKVWSDWEALMESLGLQYAIRCIPCASNNRDDAVFGVHESSSSYFLAECACTKREYRGPGAPAPRRNPSSARPA